MTMDVNYDSKSVPENFCLYEILKLSGPLSLTTLTIVKPLRRLKMLVGHSENGESPTSVSAAGSLLSENIPILPMAFLTFAEAKVGSAPPFVKNNSFPNRVFA